MARPDFCFLGEALWLDLANTVSRPSSDPDGSDLLPDQESVRAWLIAAGLPPLDPRADLAVFYALREQLVKLADTLAAGGRPPTSAIAALNGMLRSAPGREVLTRVAGAWQLRFLPVAPPGPIELLARSAAGTLAQPLGKVKRCADEGCRLLLLDMSPHQTRVWCRQYRHRGPAVDRRRAARPLATG